MKNTSYIQTNRMITEVVAQYGKESREATLMRLTVLSYKTGGSRTYNDCESVYKNLIKKA